MTELWKPGAHVVRRGIAHNRVWIVHTMSVVIDSPEQTLLLLLPGAPCKIPAGLVQRKYAGHSREYASRWDEQENPPWKLVDWVWQLRRFLTFMQPGAYYAVNVVWEHESNRFLGWYVNFEMPFRRTPIGFDTLDLELDLVIGPDYSVRWKDTEEFEEGVRRGAISAATAKQVIRAQQEVLEKVAQRVEPFDGKWSEWVPDQNWMAPQLHPNWKDI